jgi:hypothetical protein
MIKLSEMLISHLQELRSALENLNESLEKGRYQSDHEAEIAAATKSLIARMHPEIIIRENTQNELVAYSYYEDQIISVNLGKASEYRYIKQDELNEIARYRMVRRYNKLYPFDHFA